MNHRLATSSIYLLALLLSACAPMDDSQSLKRLSDSEKISALKLQQPISVVVEAMNLLADSGFGTDGASEDGLSLASTFEDNCEIRTSEDDVDPNKTKPRSRTIVIDIKPSSNKPNCPISGRVSREILKSSDKIIYPLSERGTVKIVALQPSSGIAALSQFNSLSYDYAIKREELNVSKSSSRFISFGMIERLDESRFDFGASKWLDMTIAQRIKKETRRALLNIKSDKGRAVWENVQLLENGTLVEETHKLNDEAVSLPQFEAIRQAAAN